MIYLLISITLMGWGIAGIFDKKAVAASSPKSVFLAFHFFSILMTAGLLVALPAVYGDWRLSRGVLFWEGLNAIGALIALVTYFWAMSKTQASYVLGVTAGYPIVSQLMAVPILGEPLSASRVVAAVLVSTGVAAIGYSASSEHKKLTRRDNVLVVASIVITTVSWALLGIFEKQSLAFARPLEAYLALSIWKSLLVVAATGWFLAKKQPLGLTNGATWKFSWLSAALVACGNLGFIFALTVSDANYLIVMTAGYPLVMYLSAMLFLKEKLSFSRALGIILIVAGAVAIEVM